MDFLLYVILATILKSTVQIHTEEPITKLRRNELLRHFMRSGYNEVLIGSKQLNPGDYDSVNARPGLQITLPYGDWRYTRRRPKPGLKSSKTYFGRPKKIRHPISEFQELYARTHHRRSADYSDNLSLPFIPVKNNQIIERHPEMPKEHPNRDVKVIPGGTNVWVEIVRGPEKNQTVVHTKEVGHKIVIDSNDFQYSDIPSVSKADSKVQVTASRGYTNNVPIYSSKVYAEKSLVTSTASVLKYPSGTGLCKGYNCKKELSSSEQIVPSYTSKQTKTPYSSAPVVKSSFSVPTATPISDDSGSEQSTPVEDSHPVIDPRIKLDAPEGSGEELLDLSLDTNESEGKNEVNIRGSALFEGSAEINANDLHSNLVATNKENKIPSASRFLNIFAETNDTAPCKTPKGEPGHCRNFRDCVLHEVLSNFNLYLQYMCMIHSRFVGICCPDNPVVEEVNPVENSTKSSNETHASIQPTDGCGLNTKTRIVGGTISKPHEWTWMIALLRRNRFFCGGVLINNWHVLTAAHCVLGVNIKDITVRLGEYNFNERTKHKQDILISEIKRHAKFTTLTFQHDIALLKLRQPVKFSRFIGTICLPESNNDFTDVDATVVGWGTVSFGGSASPILRQVTIPVWNNSDCDRTYTLEKINESFMCAGSPDDEQDACQGDSGGPLMHLNNQGRWQVIGLVSWGRRCGDPNFPGVYTRITTYLDWIQENMK